MGVFKASVAAIVSLMLVVANGDSPQDYLEPHNAARATVGVAPLSWSSNLATYALNYAETQVNYQKPVNVFVCLMLNSTQSGVIQNDDFVDTQVSICNVSYVCWFLNFR